MILSENVEIIELPSANEDLEPKEFPYIWIHKDVLVDYNIDFYWWRYYHRIYGSNNDVFSRAMITLKSDTTDSKYVFSIFKDIISKFSNWISRNCSVVIVPSSNQHKSSFLYKVVKKLIKQKRLAKCPISLDRTETIESAKSGNKDFNCHYSSLICKYKENISHTSNLLIIDDNYHTGVSMRAALEHILNSLSELINWNPIITTFCLGKIIHEGEIDTMLRDCLSESLSIHMLTTLDKLSYLQANKEYFRVTDEYNPPISKYGKLWNISECLGTYIIKVKHKNMLYSTTTDSLARKSVHNLIDKLYKELL
eukprot:TRINITY_DN8378_c0_g1_i1.p1 TRINITY_DN8378_c0_g1~~TRINITY_DN8378_c0_g1_i1.p1  ORF type:complete len:310 (+),score=25.00 TRINITY_DN8378_c0_g1_i1:88-1017(+)